MTNEAIAAGGFDLDDLAAVDAVEMEIKRRDGAPTGWIWTIAGPGHPTTVELANRVNKEALARAKAQEMARINGKKWRAEDETADQAQRRHVEVIATRVIGWTEVKLNGVDYPCTRENVINILLDPARGDTLVAQLYEFVGDEKAFMKRSEKL